MENNDFLAKLKAIDMEISYITYFLKRPDVEKYHKEAIELLQLLYCWRKELTKKIATAPLKNIFDEETQLYIFHQYQLEKKVKKIANNFHCSPSTVYRIVKKQKNHR